MKLSFLKYAFLSLVFFNLKVVDASDSLREIEPGVYAGQSTIKGQTIYFGMEKIDTPESKRNWKRYASHAQSIQDLYRFIDENINHISLDSIVSNKKTVQFMTGFSTQDQLDNLVMKFKGLDAQEKRDRGIGLNIGFGFAGFYDVIFYGTTLHMVYASTKEVTGRRSFPIRDAGNGYSNLLDEDVEDIIIVVGSWELPRENIFDNKEVVAYENRGIFRNPLNWFQEGKKYAGVSLKLHGFSALVRKTYFKKDLMVVNAVDSMVQVLLKTDWNPGEFIFKGTDVTEQTSEKKYFGGDTPCIIKVDALIRKFDE